MIRYLRHPAVIQIGEVGKAAEKIEQRVEFVKGENDKKNKIMNLLYSGIAPPIMIFVNQKKNCDILSRAINKVGVRSSSSFSSIDLTHTSFVGAAVPIGRAACR